MRSGREGATRSPVGILLAAAVLMAIATTILPAPVRAAAPVLEQLFPIAWQRDTTNLVEAVGKVDPWPPKIWVDGGGIALEPTTNKGEPSPDGGGRSGCGSPFCAVFQ